MYICTTGDTCNVQTCEEVVNHCNSVTTVRAYVTHTPPPLTQMYVHISQYQLLASTCPACSAVSGPSNTVAIKIVIAIVSELSMSLRVHLRSLQSLIEVRPRGKRVRGKWRLKK